MDYVVVDLEATCWEGCKPGEMEIIEIGAIFLEGDQFQIMREFNQFVRPIVNPILTNFCTELTNIKQARIDRAPTFPDAFDNFLKWIGNEPYKLCSWGSFDYDIIKLECQRHKISIPSNLIEYINLKELFARAYETKPNIGLKQAMGKLSMPFEGRLHRGIDDARNIAALAQNFLILDK